MSRYITPDGFMWIDTDEKYARVGMTKFGLDQYGQCCTFVPKVSVGTTVKSGQVLASCEGNKCLKPLRAAFTGIIVNIKDDLIDEPWKLDDKFTLFGVQGIEVDKNIRTLRA